MLSYFDPKILEEHKFLVWGPFVGELFWEYAYWVPFLKWYSITHPDTRFEVWTRHSRIALYRGLNGCEESVNCIDSIEDLNSWINTGIQNGFLLEDTPPGKLEALHEWIDDLYVDDVMIFKPPYVNRKDFFNPEHRDYSYNFDYKIYKQVMKVIYENRDRIPIVLCPPDERKLNSDFISIRNKLIESNKYLLFIMGDVAPKIYSWSENFVYRCSGPATLDFNLNALFNCKFVIGDKNNSYFKIAKTVKYLTTYSIHDKSFNIKDFI